MQLEQALTGTNIREIQAAWGNVLWIEITFNGVLHFLLLHQSGLGFGFMAVLLLVAELNIGIS